MVECSYSIKPRVDVVGPALSIKCYRWCGGTPPLIIAFPDQSRAAAIYLTRWLLWSCVCNGQYLWSNVLFECKQSFLHDNIRLGNRASFVFFSSLTLFFFTFLVFYLRSVAHIATYKVIFQNWKFSSYWVPLIWNRHKCLSYVFPLHLTTYVMGLRPL